MPSVVAVVSDIHANSTVAVCPPSVNLDDGGTYKASKAQRWLWGNWLDYWKTVKKRAKDKPLFVVLNGDLVDGDHHQTPQIITRNLETQATIALAILKPMLKLKPDYIFVVRGTESHVGKSAQWEEYLARDLGAEPEPDTGANSWWWLPLEVDKVLFDIAHHGRMGYRPWTRANASQMLAAELTINYAERGERFPRVAIRSHKHQIADSGDNYPIRVVQTPGWQVSTAYGHRLAPGSVLPVGGYIFTCDNGDYDLEKLIYRPGKTRPWTVPK